MRDRRTLIIAAVGAVLILLIAGASLLIQRQLARLVAPAPTAVPAATASPTATVQPTATPTTPPTRTPVPTSPTPAPPTATPGPPTATPLPIAGPPSPGPVVTNTKLGVGVYGVVGIDTVRLFRPAMVLLQDPDVRTAAEYRANFPKALIVGRHFVRDGDSSLADCRNASEDHLAKGQAFADLVSRTALPLKDVVNAWVSDNEQATGSDPAQLTCHAQFQTGFVEQLQGKYQIAAVAGNEASGANEPADYAKYFARPISEAAYFGIHAYGKPEARSLQTPDALYYALRYRLIHDALVKAGVGLPKNGFLLTETGLYEGWRGLVNDEQMAKDFIWLDQQLQQDSYVKGQFVFGLGPQNPYGLFEIQGTALIGMLGGYNAQHAGQP